MFDILDFPHVTTLEQAREAVRFGGINLDDLVRYLREGNINDRLAQADYYQKLARRATVEKWLGRIATVILVAAGIAFVSAHWWYAGGTS